jgi:hypothetical protein
MPIPPGACLFCLLGLPHPLDLPELAWHELAEPTTVSESDE